MPLFNKRGVNMGNLKLFCNRNNLPFEKLEQLCYQMGVSKKDLLLIEGLQYYDEKNTFIGYPPFYTKKISQLIKDNQNIYLPKYMIFFHGTGANLKEKILQEGLLPTSNNRRRSYQSTNGYVYLANDFHRACTFANLGNGENICVFAVMVKTTDIKADLDQLKIDDKFYIKDCDYGIWLDEDWERIVK